MLVSKASLRAIVELLAEGGYTAEKAAVRRIQRSDDPRAVAERVVANTPDDTITVAEADVVAALDDSSGERTPSERAGLELLADMTGASTGTGEFDDFVALFQDRYDRLSSMLSERVRARSAGRIADANRRHNIGVIGMVTDIRSTRNGHWMLEVEDDTGRCRALINTDSEYFGTVRELMYDEVIGLEGTLSDDGELLFVDELYVPEIPISNTANRADRDVKAAFISDVHVGSDEFAAEAWESFADWLDGPEAEGIEYLCIAGDMVEGVGVYPGQSEELSIVDVYEQYEAFAEHLKAVPGDLDIVMIPGNHDAVRLAEPQPGFDDDLRTILSAHDATIASNPAWIDLEGVQVLLYHGTSLDEIIAELPGSVADYDNPDRAMVQQLKKRHLAPQFGGRTRIAPEERDHLVIDRIPDIYHAGHTHTFGVSVYRDVRVINSGCWQHQTPYQRKVNIDPTVGTAAIVDLRSLDVTAHKFS